MEGYDMETTAARVVGTIPVKAKKYAAGCVEGCKNQSTEFFADNDGQAMGYAEGYFGGHRYSTGHAIEVVALTEGQA